MDEEMEQAARELEAEGYWDVESPAGGHYKLVLADKGHLRTVRVPTLTDSIGEIKEWFHERRPKGLPRGAAWNGFTVQLCWEEEEKNAKRT